MENSGQLSVLPWNDQAPPTAAQLHLQPEDDVTLPVVLIDDGRVLSRRLAACGKDEAWLQNTLRSRHFSSPREVFLMTLDERGTILCIPKEDTP